MRHGAAHARLLPLPPSFASSNPLALWLLLAAQGESDEVIQKYIDEFDLNKDGMISYEVSVYGAQRGPRRATRAPRVRALRRTHTGRHSRVAAPRPLPSPQEFMRMLLPRDLKLRISTTA